MPQSNSFILPFPSRVGRNTSTDIMFLKQQFSPTSHIPPGCWAGKHCQHGFPISLLGGEGEDGENKGQLPSPLLTGSRGQGWHGANPGPRLLNSLRRESPGGEVILWGNCLASGSAKGQVWAARPPAGEFFRGCKGRKSCTELIFPHGRKHRHCSCSAVQHPVL